MYLNILLQNILVGYRYHFKEVYRYPTRTTGFVEIFQGGILMRVLEPFVSHNNPEVDGPKVNAEILDAIERVVCEYRSFLPKGWRVIIEMVCTDREENDVYYHLDLQSNQGGGDDVLLRASSDGGMLLVPYDILVTKIADSEELCLHSKPQQIVRNTKGYVSVAFNGATDLQLNGFFELWIFKKIQKILKRNWTMDQIWWNLRAYKDNTWAQFWIKNLGIKETSR